MSNARSASIDAMIDLDAEAIVSGDHGDAFAYLGPHKLEDGRWILRAFLPEARSVRLVDAKGPRDLGTFDPVRLEGLFQIILGHKPNFPYRLRVDWRGTSVEFIDPYQFGPALGEIDLRLLREGTHFRLYECLGAHSISLGEVPGVRFAVWAPNACRVSVVGDFNLWDGRRHPMRRHPEAGIWELFLPDILEGSAYKYEIKPQRGVMPFLKADPMALRAELPPATASIVQRPTTHTWSDADWIAASRDHTGYSAPILIYEVHLGSWRRADGGARWLTYRELAEALVPYACEMGFTHVELLPVMEHPFGGSWGYQPTALFAPTSRFGSPSDFVALVDACHRAGLGVILDWVPGHFPNDPHGLASFDGTHLYEHADPRQGLHRDWDTLIYNYGRIEVQEFLINSALFWLDRYHADALRVDAVASMLYLDYSRRPGEWVPNEHGGNENLEAIAFLKRLNEVVYAEFPNCSTIAEESTAWPQVSRPTYYGGLGFGFKWNMGWMHDTLSYMSLDPIYRAYHHEKLTFGLHYAFTENFILPLSHDEVVHGKQSIFGRMPGDRWQRFANLRSYYAFMYAHPGKKLLFMGCEFAQEREWNHDQSLDWHLVEDPMHRGIQQLVRDLNLLVRTKRALHELDHERAGFDWIDAADRGASVISFIRYGRAAGDHVVAVLNFTPIVRSNYRIGMPGAGAYREIFNSDNRSYGGSGVANSGLLSAHAISWHGREHSLTLTLPPLAAIILAPSAT